MSNHFLWTEKYRPETPENYIGNTILKFSLEKYIKRQQIPHLLFSGEPGTGKTTIAKLIVANIKCDYIYINVGDEKGIDMVRDKVKNFISAASFKPLKIVILDEAAFLSKDAQPALLNMIETYSKSSRFIFTCNYPEKILSALGDRLTHFKVEAPSKKDVAIHVAGILDQEGIEYEAKDVGTIVKTYYPSIRSCIKMAQEFSDNGVLTVKEEVLAGGTYLFDILEILMSPNKEAWFAIRQILINAELTDYSDVFKYLYANAEKYAKNGYEETIFAISEAQKWQATVPDKEINAAEMFIKILKSIK